MRVGVGGPRQRFLERGRTRLVVSEVGRAGRRPGGAADRAEGSFRIDRPPRIVPEEQRRRLRRVAARLGALPFGAELVGEEPDPAAGEWRPVDAARVGAEGPIEKARDPTGVAEPRGKDIDGLRQSDRPASGVAPAVEERRAGPLDQREQVAAVQRRELSVI